MMGQCLLCGWTEKQFWASTYRAVFNLIIAKQRDDERIIRDQWEQTRFICDFVIAPHRRKGSKGRSFELPWDQEIKSEQIKVLSPEEKESLFGKYDRKIKEKLNGAR